MIPGPWEAALLALAAYRVFRLIAWDTVLDRPRAWAVTHAGEHLELFITCPYCAGFWITATWWAAWLALDDWAAAAAVPWALSAAVAIIATNLDPETRE